MARTANQILETMLGQMIMRDATLVAEIESLREKVTVLTTENMNAAPKPPTDPPKEG